jgi:hypothetical protein
VTAHTVRVAEVPTKPRAHFTVHVFPTAVPQLVTFSAAPKGRAQATGAGVHQVLLGAGLQTLRGQWALPLGGRREYFLENDGIYWMLST